MVLRSSPWESRTPLTNEGHSFFAEAPTHERRGFFFRME